MPLLLLLWTHVLLPACSCSAHCMTFPPAPLPLFATPPAARRRRQLLAQQESGSSSQPEVPGWVASDPVWQVALAAAAAGMSEHMPSGSGAASAEADESYLAAAAETADLWANFTASGGSLLPGWSSQSDGGTPTAGGGSSTSGGGSTGAAINVRSLDLSTADDESSYEDSPLPDPPAYDGSDGRGDALHRSAVAAANYSGSSSGWDELGAEEAAGVGSLGRGTGGRRLKESYFSGPAAGTILSWM